MTEIATVPEYPASLVPAPFPDWKPAPLATVVRTGNMEKSIKLDKFALAMAAAHAEMDDLKFDKELKGGKYGYKWASLANCIKTTKKLLAKHDIVLMQFPQSEKEKVTVTTMLLHKSGQYIQSEIGMTATSAKPQDIGSCYTYARRYSLTAALNISSEEDTDGVAASEIYTATDVQKSWLAAELTSLGVDRSSMKKYSNTMLERQMSTSEKAVMQLMEEFR